MSSDTANTTVVAIQGNPVNSETLGSSEDGYALTWDNTDGYWVARPLAQSGFRTVTFNSSGTWTCPAGITNILCIGYGGGGGGSSGRANNSVQGGGGGGGSLQQTAYVSVIPNTTYTITIGAGGTGGAATSGLGNNGDDGSPTTLTNGGTTLFYAIGAGGSIFNGGGQGGLNYATGTMYQIPTFGYAEPIAAGMGSACYSWAAHPVNGQANYIGGYSGGITASVDGTSGGGGGAGPGGNGGNGASSGSSGNSAAANTGAGGGGGGGNASGNGGAGGNGGSGYLYIVY